MHHLIAQFLGHQLDTQALAHSTRSRYETSPSIGLGRVHPASSAEAHFLLVTIDVDIMPVLDPLSQRVDGTRVAHHLTSGRRLVLVDPHTSISSLDSLGLELRAGFA